MVVKNYVVLFMALKYISIYSNGSPTKLWHLNISKVPIFTFLFVYSSSSLKLCSIYIDVPDKINFMAKNFI